MCQGFAEVFIESDFESIQLARQTRDLRLAQLQSEGYSCRTENLRAIDTGCKIALDSAPYSRKIRRSILTQNRHP